MLGDGRLGRRDASVPVAQLGGLPSMSADPLREPVFPNETEIFRNET